MKKERIDYFMGIEGIDFTLDKDKNGLDPEEEYDYVEYYFKDGKLWTWDWREVLSLEDIDDSWWPDESELDVTEDWEGKYLEEISTSIICMVMEDLLPGRDEMDEWLDNDYYVKTFYLLKDGGGSEKECTLLISEIV